MKNKILFPFVTVLFFLLAGNALWALAIPIEFRILDMKKTISLAGKMLSGAKLYSLDRITGEITNVNLPTYEHCSVPDSEKLNDKELVDFLKLNAKAVDMQTFGRAWASSPEGQPNFELGKVFDAFKNGQEIRVMGNVEGKKRADGVFEVTLHYLDKIFVNGKQVYQYHFK
ncbi:MAG: hypothetical protein HQM08_29600 [Candidatus Riflebacteria bacterium]|nr:hypothetical protein [Candidatus Riflebacteria bacterium]